MLEGKRVKQFSWLEKGNQRLFVDASAFTIDGVKALGFFELLTDGELKLFKKTELYTKKPDYSVQFNVGSRDEQILKKEVYYMVKDNHATLVESNKKIFMHLEKRPMK